MSSFNIAAFHTPDSVKEGKVVVYQCMGEAAANVTFALYLNADEWRDFQSKVDKAFDRMPRLPSFADDNDFSVEIWKWTPPLIDYSWKQERLWRLHLDPLADTPL